MALKKINIPGENPFKPMFSSFSCIFNESLLTTRLSLPDKIYQGSVNMGSKSKGFKSLGIALAALLSTNIQVQCNEVQLNSGQDLKVDSSNSLIIERSEYAKNSVISHYSHQSHMSHRSHSSHYSGY